MKLAEFDVDAKLDEEISKLINGSKDYSVIANFCFNKESIQSVLDSIEAAINKMARNEALPNNITSIKEQLNLFQKKAEEKAHLKLILKFKQRVALMSLSEIEINNLNQLISKMEQYYQQVANVETLDKRLKQINVILTTTKKELNELNKTHDSLTSTIATIDKLCDKLHILNTNKEELIRKYNDYKSYERALLMIAILSILALYLMFETNTVYLNSKSCIILLAVIATTLLALLICEIVFYALNRVVQFRIKQSEQSINDIRNQNAPKRETLETTKQSISDKKSIIETYEREVKTLLSEIHTAEDTRNKLLESAEEVFKQIPKTRRRSLSDRALSLEIFSPKRPSEPNLNLNDPPHRPCILS